MNDKNGRQYRTGAKRIFIGNSRAQKRADNNLGVISYRQNKGTKKFRTVELDLTEKYLESKQYDHLAPWQECCSSETYVQIRKRKPSVIFPFSKTFQDRVSSKLVGSSTFPSFKIQESENDNFFLQEIIKTSFFAPMMLDCAKHFITYTSGFSRFKLVNGTPKIENYAPNYCYPVLDDAGELISIEVKYVYETEEYDPSTGKMVCKWYRLEMNKERDVLYDNPVYHEDKDPEFNVVETVEHNLGFVQGQWFRWGETNYDVDGSQLPLTVQIQGFIDAINYNLSQSDSATSYGLDPQLVISGMDEDDVENLIKSSSKAWLLGRPENKASFLEVNGSGVKTAKEMEDRLMKRAADAARIVFLDPEKMASSAQSGKAMEVMNAPMVELINELRPWFEKSMESLLQKIFVCLLKFSNQGFDIAYEVPQGYEPESLDITCSWPPVYELTIQDIQQIVSIGLAAANGNIIARDTAAKWIQKMGVDFGVEDWEAETAKINGQQQFGGFF